MRRRYRIWVVLMVLWLAVLGPAHLAQAQAVADNSGGRTLGLGFALPQAVSARLWLTSALGVDGQLWLSLQDSALNLAAAGSLLFKAVDAAVLDLYGAVGLRVGVAPAPPFTLFGAVGLEVSPLRALAASLEVVLGTAFGDPAIFLSSGAALHLYF